MVLGGFLASLRAVNFGAVFLVMLLGHTINGYGWYLVGYLGGATVLDKWGHRQRLSHEIIEKISYYFNRYSGKTIMLTKFTFSFQIAALILAGTVKYSIRDFSRYNFLGSLGWTIMTVFVGYFFGQSFQLVRTFLRNFSYFLVFLGGALSLIIIFKLLMKSAIMRSLRLEEKFRLWNLDIKHRLDEFLRTDTKNHHPKQDKKNSHSVDKDR